jgi:hypothetical protein
LADWKADPKVAYSAVEMAAHLAGQMVVETAVQTAVGMADWRAA